MDKMSFYRLALLAKSLSMNPATATALLAFFLSSEPSGDSTIPYCAIDPSVRHVAVLGAVSPASEDRTGRELPDPEEPTTNSDWSELVQVGRQ